MSLKARLNKNNTETAAYEDRSASASAATAAPPGETRQEQYQLIIDRVRSAVIEKLRGQTAEPDGAQVQSVINEVLLEHADTITRVERTRLSSVMFNEVMGLGPLEELLSDSGITEIMVNGPRHVFVEERGKLRLSNVKLRDDEAVMQIIEKIVAAIGRHVDEASPMVDARLKDGSRVNIIIPPLSLTGPVITIRKFSKKPFTVHDLIDFGSLTPRMASFLEACVKGNLNIMVAGGTGSGKTTLLNVLSSYIPADQRIVTIEDAAELQLNQQHVITLESRPSNLEGKGEITIRDLVKNALRMRPDRIIVGEVRSGEALDMLQAMNTGHDGSLTTGHANSPRDMIARIETMVMMAGVEMPLFAIRSQIASALDVIVQQSRLRDGTRRVTSITEITGMEGDVVSMQDIFTFETDGSMDGQGRFNGRFKSTGIYPKCINKIRTNGVAVHDEWFS